MSETTTTVQWSTCPNPDVRIINTRCRFRFGQLGIDDDFVENLTDAQRCLMKEILAIHGVERVSCGGYSVSVGKGAAFTWDEIGPLAESRVLAYQQKYGK